MSDEGADDEEIDVPAVRERLASVEADLDPIREDLESIGDDLADVRERLDAAETEDDLDAVEDALDPVSADLDDVREAFDERREAIEEIEIPDPEADEDEDEAEVDDPFADLRAERDAVEEELDAVEGEIGDVEDEVDEIESGVEDRRGPYAEDVVAAVESANGDVEDTRWAAEGRAELRTVVEDALAGVNDALGTSLSLADGEGGDGASESGDGADDGSEEIDALVAALDRVEAAVEEADLDPDDDAGTIAALLETTDDLQSGVDDATAWTDLAVRERMRREGFYDVLDHVKDFPPEWHALKVHEKRGNAEMILLAYEMFDSGFMEEHCLDALGRMGPEEAIEPMLQQANRRDKAAIGVLGTIGVPDDDVVETLLDYVDASSDPQLQKVTFRALGEMGAEEAVSPIAGQLVAENAETRSSAARALGLIGDTRAIPALADVLADDEVDAVRASAAWALVQIGTEEALAPVADYADDDAYLVQAEAKKVDIEPAV